MPGAPATVESDDLVQPDLERLMALLEAAWAIFDDVSHGAQGTQLTKGPRGGGRDPDQIVDHVREAEAAYLGQLGSRAPDLADEDPARPMDLLRAAYLATLRARVAGQPVPNPRRTRRPWSPRYAIRRSAWHSLDHAWEIEDRAPTR